MHIQLSLRLLGFAALAAVPMALSTAAAAAEPDPLPLMPPTVVPSKVVDLLTPEGSAVFGAQWKSMEARLVEGPPIPSAMPEYKKSFDIQPHAGEAGFDDSAWPVIGAKGLYAQRGGGKASFIWYRANLAIPAKIGDFDTKGTTVVLTVNVDDYAEVWVNGHMPRYVTTSPATIQGFNTPNRVVLTQALKPGDKFQIAVFGINGPISVAPENLVWFREAKLEFYDDRSLRGPPH